MRHSSLCWYVNISRDQFSKRCPAAQVRQVAEEAIARARRGEGPTLIEAETYRFRGHSLADPDELRSKEEKDYWLVRPEPLARCSSPKAPVRQPGCAVGASR